MRPPAPARGLLRWLISNKAKNRLLVERLPPRLVIEAGARVHRVFGEAELRLLPALVSPEKAAVDVGANKGIYAWHLSRLCSAVHAFEPNPKLAAFLRRGVGANVVVHESALSDRSGTATLRVPVLDGVEHDARASIDAGIDAAPPQGSSAVPAESATETVRTRCLDEFDLGKVGFMKVDVEGHEREVLRGARGLIERERPVLLVEIDRQLVGTAFDETIGFVEGLGYRTGFVLQGRLHPLSDFEPEVHQPAGGNSTTAAYVNNFVFCPAERFDAVAAAVERQALS